MRKITKETTLAKIMKNPQLVKILAKYHFPCLWCPMAQFEVKKLKIGKVCEVYNIDIKKLLKDLNKQLKSKKDS